MKRKTLFFSCAIPILLLILTNPSVTDFKQFFGTSSDSIIRRKYNFFVCSYFSLTAASDINYLGIAGNFFKIKNRPSPVAIKKNQKIDNAKIDSSSSTIVPNEKDEYNIPIKKH